MIANPAKSMATVSSVEATIDRASASGTFRAGGAVRRGEWREYVDAYNTRGAPVGGGEALVSADGWVWLDGVVWRGRWRGRDGWESGEVTVSRARANPSARELAVRGAAGARTLARRASPHVKAAARATGVAVRRGAVATGRALASGARRAAPHVKAAARATGRAVVRGARATGRAIKRGSKKAAPHVARGLRGVAGRLDAWASANPSRFYWVSGGYRCGHKHPSVKAATACALRHVAQGTVKVMRW